MHFTFTAVLPSAELTVIQLFFVNQPSLNLDGVFFLIESFTFVIFVLPIPYMYGLVLVIFGDLIVTCILTHIFPMIFIDSCLMGNQTTLPFYNKIVLRMSTVEDTWFTLPKVHVIKIYLNPALYLRSVN